MDVIGYAQEIFGIAKAIYDMYEEIDSFKNRCLSLKYRIDSFTPVLDELIRMQDDRDKIIQMQKKDNVQLPVLSKALQEILQVVKLTEEFVRSLVQMSFFKKLKKKKYIKDQFDTFSERLDVLQYTVQLGVLADMSKLVKHLVQERQKMTDLTSELKRRLASRRQAFRNRQDQDVDDDAKDFQDLCVAAKKIKEGKSIRATIFFGVGDGATENMKNHENSFMKKGQGISFFTM